MAVNNLNQNMSAVTHYDNGNVTLTEEMKTNFCFMSKNSMYTVIFNMEGYTLDAYIYY